MAALGWTPGEVAALDRAATLRVIEFADREPSANADLLTALRRRLRDLDALDAAARAERYLAETAPVFHASDPAEVDALAIDLQALMVKHHGSIRLGSLVLALGGQLGLAIGNVPGNPGKETRDAMLRGAMAIAERIADASARSRWTGIPSPYVTITTPPAEEQRTDDQP